MEFGGLDRWMASIASTKRTSSRIIDADHLADLYATLPLRSRAAPADRTALGYGHHFAFFHPHVPEVALRPDGTESDFSPPEPFTRRMWVGGWIKWRSPILVGERATEYTELSSAEKKGNDLPMVFVTKRIRIQVEGKREPALEEERTHVFLHSSMHKKGVREVEGLPPPSFSFQYTPSPTTLFRFSALTFNSHLIHLDKDYAQSSEDYPERLVHAPLNAIMLLETLLLHAPDARPKSFEYRARNPMIVNRPITIRGARDSASSARLWCVDDTGVVGMTARVQF